MGTYYMPGTLLVHFVLITCEVGIDMLTLQMRKQGSGNLQVVRSSFKKSLSGSKVQCELPATPICLMEEKSPFSLEGLYVSGK